MFLGFRGSHSAGNPVPLPVPPDPPGTAPDPHDEEDFEGPDTRSLMDGFMAKLSQSVDDDYKNLSALLKTLPYPSVHTGPIAIPVAEACEKGLNPKAYTAILQSSSRCLQTKMDAETLGHQMVRFVSDRTDSVWRRMCASVSCDLHRRQLHQAWNPR